MYEDSWSWNREKLGHYSVKSAYKCIQEDKDHNMVNTNAIAWIRIWNLKITQKVKVFIWRALSNCIPTKDQLIFRRVNVNQFCPVCSSGYETNDHILLICPFALNYWNQCPWFAQMHNLSFMKWMHICSHQDYNDQLAKVRMISQALWSNRNSIVWHQKGVEPAELVKLENLSLNQWRIAQDKMFDNYLGFMTLADDNEQWQLPPNDAIKVNTDTACFEESNSYAYAMVTRDHAGELIEVRTAGKQGKVDPMMAEAISIRESLSWIKYKVWSRLVLETDCLAVVQALRCSSINLSYLGHIINECKRLLRELQNHDVRVNFVKRSANRVAHSLARNSSSIAKCGWVKGDVLPYFFHVMFDDLSDQ